MSIVLQHMDEVGERFRSQLAAFERQGMLIDMVERRTAEFFAKYPGISRTPRREAFLFGLFLEELLSAVSDSQSAPAPAEKPTVKKVA